jgi:hypothetical protein
VGQAIEVELLEDHDPGCGTMRMYGLGDFQPFG